MAQLHLNRLGSKQLKSIIFKIVKESNMTYDRAREIIAKERGDFIAYNN